MEKSWVRNLGAFEIVGALFILGFGLDPRLSPTELHFRIPFIAWAVASFTFLAGMLLVGGHRSGILMSFGAQLAQVMSFSAGCRYVFLAGPKVTWVIASVGTKVYVGGGGLFVVTDAAPDGTLNAIGLAADVAIGFMEQPLATASWSAGLNLLALYFALRLWRLWHETAPQPRGVTP